jgi:DNA invertase Pin-like site-specific DNA recombinase
MWRVLTYHGFMEKLGYVRVSTAQQTTDQQRDALEAAGVDASRIFEDVMSGARTDRPGLQRLLDYAREGDTVTVVALDRLGRSTIHVLQTMAELNERGIILKSQREGVDFSTPVGQMVAAIMSAMAEMERTLIRERAAAAREAARIRGRHTGRPRALTNAQAALARRMRASGEPIPTIARTLGVSRATVYRVIAVGEKNATVVSA